MKSSASYSSVAQRQLRIPVVAMLRLALLLLIPAGAFAQTAVPPSVGNGLTTATAYQMTVLGNLVWIQQQAAAQATAGKYYKLMNDIDASVTASWNDSGTTTDTLEGFNPIGETNLVIDKGFKGEFLGQGHRITNLVVNRPSRDFVGLFGYIGSGGKVKDLGIEGGSVTGHYHVGGLAGNSHGTILNCHATDTVKAIAYYAGGLVGYNYGSNTISNCYATGSVTGTSDNVGGLVGCSYGPISDSYATGSVTGSGYFVGGLVGISHYSMISNCYATGKVQGTNRVGGLVGYSGGSYGRIIKCYAVGAVTGNAAVGGLVGCNNESSIVSDCYATGSVKGNTATGGLVGENDEDCEVMNCYATGAVSGSANIGGLVGKNYSGTITTSFWNSETSGLSTSDGGAGLATFQMKQQSFFTGWAFTSVWNLQGGDPYLRDLTTCTLTYVAGSHGQVGDGLTTGTTLAQVVNLGSTGTPVKAVALTGYCFDQWSSGSFVNPRTDAGLTTDTSVTAQFVPLGPPTVMSVSALTNDPTPTWTWTTGGGARMFRYQLDGEADGSWTETAATAWTSPTDLDFGAHTLYVQERDASGNWSASGSFTVTVKPVNAALGWRGYR